MSFVTNDINNRIVKALKRNWESPSLPPKKLYRWGSHYSKTILPFSSHDMFSNPVSSDLADDALNKCKELPEAYIWDIQNNRIWHKAIILTNRQSMNPKKSTFKVMLPIKPARTMTGSFKEFSASAFKFKSFNTTSPGKKNQNWWQNSLGINWSRVG